MVQVVNFMIGPAANYWHPAMINKIFFYTYIVPKCVFLSANHRLRHLDGTKA